MINWVFFPKAEAPHHLCGQIVAVFQKHDGDITSDKQTLDSNGVLRQVAADLATLGSMLQEGRRNFKKCQCRFCSV